MRWVKTQGDKLCIQGSQGEEQLKSVLEPTARPSNLDHTHQHKPCHR